MSTDFDRSVDIHGDSPKSVGWINQYTQELRFFVLSLIGDLEKKTILDVGCGLGDLFSYLNKNNHLISDYLGIDNSKKMIDQAQKKNPHAKFEELDFFSDAYQEVPNYDFIMASGTFNYIQKDQITHIQTAIKNMFFKANIGVAFNLLSAYTPAPMKTENTTLFYYDPIDILKFCLKLTHFVEFKQNYLPNDFTIFLYK